jgi:uncharacterized protein
LQPAFAKTAVFYFCSTISASDSCSDTLADHKIIAIFSSGTALLIYHIEVFLIGIGIGFLGGVFGKGGSAIATPLLSLAGAPGYIAVATPLPATIPGTLVASVAYWRARLWNRTIIVWTVLIGIPATIIGSYLSKFTGARPLLYVTGLLVLGFGLSFLFQPKSLSEDDRNGLPAAVLPSFWKLRITGLAIAIGLISGLLANSGGFLLAPSFARILKQPIKAAFASSLLVSAGLAAPATFVHWWLGHIAWREMFILAAGSVPCSYLGARVALRLHSRTLERLYGLVLTAFGLFFLGKLLMGMSVHI